MQAIVKFRESTKQTVSVELDEDHMETVLGAAPWSDQQVAEYVDEHVEYYSPETSSLLAYVVNERQITGLRQEKPKKKRSQLAY